ncbi:TOS4 [Candida jiufengensis]|uniref:TOS4 n=1 Tax=Candida jiufengensis TaxID=497108 RepID=UPI002224AA14|nr:TOS4 [Candida jiufengensis]KAI5951592.1 TOS4 [Candida jiufengensis]
MSYNYQFPPSSPLHDDVVADDKLQYSKDPFAVKKHQNTQLSDHRLGRDKYPTPNPSSSLFRSSSPARGNNFTEANVAETEEISKSTDLNEEVKTSISINKDFNILNPDKDVTRIPLLSEKNQFYIGRSSKNCEYPLTSKDSFISRIHVKISYDQEQIVLECTGSNGATIIIPKPCYVHSTNTKNNYIITENKNNKLINASSIKSKSIKLNSNYSEFYIHKGEILTLPKFKNIMLEISKQIILINPHDVEENLTEDDDELTDDEELILIDKTIDNDIEDNEKVVEETTPMNKISLNSSIPNTPSKSRNELNIDEEDNYETPSKEYQQIKAVKFNESNNEESDKSIIQETKQQHIVKIMHPKPTKITSQFSIFQDNKTIQQQRSSSISPKIVLKDKTNTIRRALSEEPKSINHNEAVIHIPQQEQNENNEQQPPKKKKKTSVNQPIVEFDNSVLSLPNLEEINNIFINHLAFSRLSSTPISILNTISQLTSNLTNLQIKTILNNIKCIGIICRQGKDAAGKPLEEEYYYMVENDEDLNRKNLVSNVKGHGGLRSCRKVHKQYYWKKPAPIKK